MTNKARQMRDLDNWKGRSRITLRVEYEDGGHNEMSTTNPSGTVQNLVSALFSLLIVPQRFPGGRDD